MFGDCRANNKVIHLHYEHPIIANLEVIAFEGEKAPVDGHETQPETNVKEET